MTAPMFKDLQKLVAAQQQEKARNELYDRLINKPFWIWNKEEHKQADIDTDGDCCFNHIIGLPQKDGIDKPLYDYEEIIFESLSSEKARIVKTLNTANLVRTGNKHLWIKKATGLGVSEFMLRFMAWLCLKDNALSGHKTFACISKSLEGEVVLLRDCYHFQSLQTHSIV